MVALTALNAGSVYRISPQYTSGIPNLETSVAQNLQFQLNRRQIESAIFTAGDGGFGAKEGTCVVTGELAKEYKALSLALFTSNTLVSDQRMKDLNNTLAQRSLDLNV